MRLNGRGYRLGGSQLGIWSPAAALLVIHVVGHGKGEFAALINEAFDRVTSNGARVHLFIDLGRMSGYDTALRVECTEHFRTRLASFESLQVLVQSRFVAMGVAVANLALRGLVTVHTLRAAFDHALDNQLTEHGVVGFSSEILAS